MPSHQERREPLPAGYQFGDARPVYGDSWSLQQYVAAERADAYRLGRSVSFDEAVACIRRSYGDRTADYWATHNADSWNVTEGEAH